MMKRDQLFLLSPGFADPAFPEKVFYCAHCAMVEGVLLSNPAQALKLDIHRVAYPRPRQEVVALVGEKNQALPLLVLADGERSEYQTGNHNGVNFVSGVQRILSALAERHGFPEAHP